MTATIATVARPKAAKPFGRSRTWWLKQFHTWHWISAAVSLVMMLMFAVTGITLNHAASIPASESKHEVVGQLPPLLLARLGSTPADKDAPLPADVAVGVRAAVGLDPAARAGEWSDDEVYVAMPRPGGDAWVSVDRATGKVTGEATSRGWISYLNDLHKGRNTGAGWQWFIDLFAAACILFTVTGLVLLKMNARIRSNTWPIVGAGFALPVIVAILFIH